MDVEEREPGDRGRLTELSRSARDAKQRDRYRAVGLALDGEETEWIMETLDRSKNFVQRWTYAYRDGGLQALTPRKQTGRPCKLTAAQQTEFQARLDAGATEADGVCTLRGPDLQRILQESFNVSYSLNGVYALLGRLGYSCLRPRPRHENNDPAAMEQWKKETPLLSSASASSTPASASRSGARTRPASGRRAH